MLGMKISRASSHKCGYDNIASAFDFLGPGLKVKVTTAFLEKKCHRSRANIYQWIF